MAEAKTKAVAEKKDGNFLFAVNAAEGGGTLADLNREITNLIAQVQIQGKQGSITLKLTLKPQHNSPQITVKSDIAVSAPKVEREVTILYTDADGNFSRRDPRQPKLEGLVRSFAPTDPPQED